MCVNTGLFRFLVNNNPFYLISTLLLLYGLQMATESTSIGVDWPLVLAGIQGGMVLAMAATAIAIVRLGGVWDDARTILLSIMLLLVGVVVSCDPLVLENKVLATQIMAAGLLFAVGVWELLLRVLGIRFPWLIRLPVYLMHALIFFWSLVFTPPGHETGILGSLDPSWRVYLFGWVFAAAMLTCLPAVWRGRNLFRNNGSPWKWPLFPWSIIVVLVAAACLRLYMLSLAFIPEFGWESPLGLHFFMPIAFAGFVLVVEIINSFYPKGAGGYVWLGVPVLMVAMPVEGSELYVQFLADLTNTIANPLWIALVLIVLFGASLWLRGRREVELGVHAFLLAAIFIHPWQVELSPAPVSAWPLLALAGFHAARAWQTRSSRLWTVALAFVVVATWIGLTAMEFSPGLAAAGCVNVAWLGLLAIGLAYRDRFAIWLRIFAVSLSNGLVGAAIAGVLFQHWPSHWAAYYLGMLQLVLILSWFLSSWALFLRLAVVLTPCLAIGFYGSSSLPLQQWFGERSGFLLLAAVGCFLLGLLISSAKAGWLNSVVQDWQSITHSIRTELETATN